MSEAQSMAIQRGVYLAADTPRSFIPLALEGGDGDKQLLAEALNGILTDEELEGLHRELGKALGTDD